MDPFIVIRDFKPGDEFQCYAIVNEGIMSTVNTAFITGLTREITFQMMVLVCAIMFIFFGLPFGFCFASIPTVIVFIYLCVWCGHKFKVVQTSQDIWHIPRVYMSSNYTGFWVAEIYNPVASVVDKSAPVLKYSVYTEAQIKRLDIDVVSHFKKIVGTIAITRSKTTEGYARLRKMAVKREFRRKGIASALLNEALQFCEKRDYKAVELVTTECHDISRQFFVNKGFELKQMYSKHIVGSVVSILMYELSYCFKKHKINISGII